MKICVQNLYNNSVVFLRVTIYFNRSWAMFSVYPSITKEVRKEGNVLFNDALYTFCLRLYGVGHMVKDHSDSERGNHLPPHGLLFSISSKVSFTCTIPQRG